MPTVPYKSFGPFVIVLLLACLISGTVRAAELLVVTSPTCPYCKVWEIEVGSIYDKTEESKRAPLQRIDIKRIDTVPYRFREPVRYTPTFILLDKSIEVGRIVGYSNDAAFWGLLDELLTKLQPGKDSFNPIKS